MKKSDLINLVSEKTGQSKADTESAINAFTEVVEEQLKAGEDIPLIGFGTFYVKSRSERQGRNPKTGDAITIPASKSGAFKPGAKLKGL